MSLKKLKEMTFPEILGSVATILAIILLIQYLPDIIRAIIAFFH